MQEALVLDPTNPTSVDISVFDANTFNRYMATHFYTLQAEIRSVSHDWFKADQRCQDQLGKDQARDWETWFIQQYTEQTD